MKARWQVLLTMQKNYGSMITSYNKGTTLERKQQLEKDLTQWINASADRKAKYGEALAGLNKLIAKDQSTQARDMILGYLGYNKMLSTAYRLHRLAIEKQKPNLERQRGYQERDMARFEQGLKAFDRRYDADIDREMLFTMLKHYANLPASERIAAIDKFFNLGKKFDEKRLAKQLKKMYSKSSLADQEQRLAWFNKTEADFNKSKDPFIQLAVATFETRDKLEKEGEELYGNIQAYRPKYMEALIAYFNAKNLPVYADANSTLRITYGNVKGYSPRDGLTATPFTTLEGIVEKDTGVTPFDAPKKQLELIEQKAYGEYIKTDLGSVPVNYLGTLDITGGNSGSPTLNDKAEFVGLVFDGVYESIIGDWGLRSKT